VTREDHVQKLGGALGWGVLARLLRMGLGLVGSVLVVRGLGAHEYGVLAVLRTTLAFVGIAVGAGLTQGLLRYLPAWRLSGEAHRARRALTLSLLLQVGLWLVAIALFAGLRPWVGNLSNPTVAGLLLLGTALLLPEVVGNTATQFANAHYDSRGVSAAVVVSTVVYVAVVAFLLRSGAGVAGVLWASAVSNGVLALWLLRRTPAYLRTAPASETVPPDGDAGFGKALRYSAPFLVIGILNLITWRQSEVLFLGHFRSAAEAGFFDLAYRFPQMILEFVPGAIWPLVMAGFSEIYTRDRDALQRATSAYYKLLFLLVAPLSVGGILTGDLAIRLLYGGAFIEAGAICQIFFLIFSVSFLSTPLSMVLYVLERPWLGLGIYAVNAAVNVGLDLVLIPRYGLWGAVIPVSLVILVSPVPYLWVLRRMGVRVRLPWGFLGRIYLASGGMLLLWPLRGWVRSPETLAMLVLAGILIFWAGLRLFRVMGPSERSLIERVNPAIWNRIEPILVGRPVKERR
jgi:O-antigen/teichoic acid export membrane protein